jgi:hypothetical protein
MNDGAGSSPLPTKEQRDWVTKFCGIDASSAEASGAENLSDGQTGGTAANALGDTLAAFTGDDATMAGGGGTGTPAGGGGGGSGTAARKLTVECQFWSSPSGVPQAGELEDALVEIGITIWDGRGNRILWPAKGKGSYVTASTVNGLIVSPWLSGIEADEITIMARVRFGESQVHQITGAFPLPNSDRFRLTAYVEFKTTSEEVSAKDVDAAVPKAQAQLIKATGITEGMIRGALTKSAGHGNFAVELDHYTGNMWFGPKPAAMLGKQ